MKLRYRVRPW